jgi:ribonucleoside-triphosphate reductase
MTSAPSVPFGPTGETVYTRTYSRPKPDGSLETWPETVARVAEGNLSLVHGPRSSWSREVHEEYARLFDYMLDFRLLPGGRHLWASGVKGRQYLFNCHVAGWGESLSEHFEFTFQRLAEGGGVGANYSSRHLAKYGAPRRSLKVHVVCDPSHPDYEAMVAEGLISTDYSHEWTGAFPVEDSREGIAAALVDLVDTFMTDAPVEHENRVFDMTRVRRKGAPLRTFGGTASGPLPFARLLHKVAEVMNGNRENGFRLDVTYAGARQMTPLDAMAIDHAIGEAVVAGGVRRSARMSIVHWRDPFVLDFLACKEDPSQHWTTNISVEVDDDFTADMARGGSAAWLILQKVAERMLTNGEPGLWNSSLSNEGEVGEVIATNPCGEIALEAWENCNLGHVNLDAFASGGLAVTADLREAHVLMTRFLMRATYGDVNDPKQAARLASNRRIGVGHLGVHGFLVKQGIRYSAAPYVPGFEALLEDLYLVVREEARRYAFRLRMPEPVKVTTVAPTGTIAKMPGVAEGIHPIYSTHFLRRVRFSMTSERERDIVERAEFDGFHVEPDQYDPSGNTVVVTYPTKDILVEQVEALGLPGSLVEGQSDISPADLLRMQALYQRAWADNAVSFTVNIPAEPHQDEALASGALTPPPPSAEAVASLVETLTAALPGLKGTTVMLDGSRPQAPYERITAADYEAAAARLVADGVDEDCASGACPVR